MMDEQSEKMMNKQFSKMLELERTLKAAFPHHRWEVDPTDAGVEAKGEADYWDAIRVCIHFDLGRRGDVHDVYFVTVINALSTIGTGRTLDDAIYDCERMALSVICTLRSAGTVDNTEGKK